MIRLAHKLLTGNVTIERGNDPAGLKSRCDELVADLASGRAPVVIADNVEDHWASVGKMPIKLNQACLMPPFQSFFIEAMIDVTGGKKSPFGWWFNQRDGFLEAIFDSAPSSAAKSFLSHPRDRRLTGTMIGINLRNGVPRYIEHGVCILLNEEGIKENMLGFAYGFNPLPLEMVSGMFAIPLMTLAFMNCSNVARVDVTESEAPPRSWCRQQRVPELKYQAVLIDPNLETYRPGDRKTEGDRSGKSLHICRGHFAHYHDDGVSRGLFGKGIYGFFWIPSHVRGSSEQGTVVSTYVVKAPKK